MATLFLDYENGNDNYAGTSFELLASGTDGRISLSTFSSAGASFPNDGSLIGQYLSIFNGSSYIVYSITAWISSASLTIAQIPGGTSLNNQSVDRQFYIGGRWRTLNSGALGVRINAGDTLRMMGSPAPTSIGDATWTSSTLQGVVNPGNNNFTNTTPIVVNRAGHGFSTGDVVVVTQVAGNTSANGTWDITVINANSFSLDGSSGNGTSSSGSYRLRNNTRVQLASALTQTIASTGPRSAWTASTNVTTTLNTTDYKEHQYSDSIAIAAGFTTGKAAYWATGTLDLSSYQQVSFWIKQTAGTIGAADACFIALCSDTNGATVVNTINIPNITVLNNWMVITVDTGAALGSSIGSIAFYVNTDNGAQTFLINNIIACKASGSADSLTLSSLIGKNRPDDTWYGIQSISNTRIMLDNVTSTLPTATTLRGYSHSSGTETVTTYKRETIKYSINTSISLPTESGTPSSPITYSGGWDRTSMSTQDSETWMDGSNGTGTFFYNTASGGSGFYIAGERLYGVRFARVFADFATGNTYTNVGASNSGSMFIQQNSSGESIIDGVKVQGCSQALEASSRGTVLTVSNFDFYGCSSSAFCNSGSNGCFYTAKNGRLRNSPSAISFYSQSSSFESVTTTDNDVSFLWNTSINVFCKKCVFNETTEFLYQGTADRNSITYSQDHDNVAGNHKIFSPGGLITADSVIRHTASGLSWRFSPTSTIANNQRFPLRLSLAKVAVAANALVTIKAWMYRDNSDLTMRLVCKGGQIAGVTSDATSAVTAVNSWEEQTISFTPTEQGVVEITAEAYGGSTYNGWVDDMTISQAV